MTSESYTSHLSNLLGVFEKKSYSALGCERGTTEYEVIEHCSRLLKLDYIICEVPNLNGELCSTYPSRILIPESEKAPPGLNGVTSTHSTAQPETIYEGNADCSRLRNHLAKSKFARCRKRFPIPVILYRGKHICRSATVSLEVETIGRRAVEIVMQQGAESFESITGVSSTSCSSSSNRCEPTPCSSSELFDEDDLNEEPLSNNWDVFNNEPVLKSDIYLLNKLNVGTIFDLMVEMKKVKYFMYVSSSEKADEENRYSDFEIVCLPYPGCEFFRTYRDNSYTGENLMFDWSQHFIDASITIPDNAATQSLQIAWNEYKTWDLVQITQNYLKLILKYIQDFSTSILIHCISGWDRTPLFVSLVRLSLWADGLIHKSLTAAEITYYTVAYDWYLFGHQLPDRRARLEEILFFCFHFLKNIEGDEYQVVSGLPRTRTKTVSSSASSIVVLQEDMLHDADPFDDENLNPNMNNAPGRSSNENLSINKSPQKKTSPVSVPGGSGRSRQRNESTSSNEWTNVTETGSIDTSGLSVQTTRSFMDRLNSQNISGSRKERLADVRTFFIRVYSKVCGLQFQDGTNSSLGTLLGSIVERVGETFR